MRSKGFTLVELLAVISILGVSAILGLPSLLSAFNNSKKILDSYTEDGIIDAAKTYITDIDLGTIKYTYNSNTPFKSIQSGITYNKGDVMKTYDFKLYLDSVGEITVPITTLVSGGYYNKGCDYATKNKDCVIKDTCLVTASIIMEKNNAGYFVSKGYEAKILSGCEKNN